MASFSAVVAGATGACGRDVIAALVASPRCTRITVLCRSITTAKVHAKLARTASGGVVDDAVLKQKLKVAEVDWEALAEDADPSAAGSNWPGLVGGHDLGINCLGTTRKDAHGPSGFVRVDRDYYSAFARACKACGVGSYVQVSAMNADARSFFVYPKTKGEMDDLAVGLGFDKCWVLRPGLLERGDVKRGVEKMMMACLMPAIPVSVVGGAAVAAYEKQLGEGAAVIMTNKELRAAVS